MPGNSWRNLSRGSDSNTGSDLGTSPSATSTGPRGGSNSAAAANPHLDLLLQQRQELESNLRNLVSGTSSDQREAARFHVPTFAQRQAQHRQWERQREQQQQVLGRKQREQGVVNSLENRADQAERMRTGLRNFQQPVSDWMDERDQERQSLRSRFDSAERELKDSTRPLKNIGKQVGSASQQLKDLDRQLAAEGSDSDREELRKLGTDKIHKADKTLQKINGIIDAPSRAVKKIDDFWQARDNQISGAMDRFGPYADNARRRLNLDQGGSGDLFERMQRNRENALERRREQRQEQMRDQARRDRALQRRKKKNEEDI